MPRLLLVLSKRSPLSFLSHTKGHHPLFHHLVALPHHPNCPDFAGLLSQSRRRIIHHVPFFDLFVQLSWNDYHSFGLPIPFIFGPRQSLPLKSLHCPFSLSFPTSRIANRSINSFAVNYVVTYHFNCTLGRCIITCPRDSLLVNRYHNRLLTTSLPFIQSVCCQLTSNCYDLTTILSRRLYPH
ncbi:hypothetical protein M501DRAFT_862806 [Patellaria atrata CBS 101060]|uniref:Uncharacterized protein n=1 Tax=Patellaria atrata CBS 101060 TaxID=1346257 RepID=A0A9P4S8T6_9PEZI|nr:hypothetical protein M501DRAFT_862806 [Patellaria atrata CBS 101060]